MAQQAQLYGSPEPMGQQGQEPGVGQQAQHYGQSQQVSQQPGQMGQQPPGEHGLSLEEAISDEMRVALHDFVQSANVCEWCADQCIDEGPQMAECIRLCRDVADLATLNTQFLTRDSLFGPEIAEVFAIAAEACAQECAQHPHKHCQRCAEVLSRAARSTRKMLMSFESSQGTQMQQGGPIQQQQGAQMGPSIGGQF